MKSKNVAVALLLAITICLCQSCQELANISSTNVGKRYSSVSINSVQITSYPSQNVSKNLPWDPLGNAPDLYFKITNKVPTGVKTRNNIKQSELPITWVLDPKNIVYNLSNATTISVYDDDMDSSDLMGEFNFTPNNYTGQTSVTLSSKGVSVTLSLTWQ